ncbi:MAG: stage V sporulation protein AE [Lachnospiraceae bacterium]|nr:stage V sporulation protein AE [Lachnospiraceae bacterium]
MEFVKAFLVGGAICAIVQVFLDKTKLLPGRIMTAIVCIGVILGAIGIYEPFSEWAGSGATIPLFGFGNTLFKGVKEAVDKEGFFGIFKGGLTKSAAGITAALVFAYLAALFFKPKMKE